MTKRLAKLSTGIVAFTLLATPSAGGVARAAASPPAACTSSKAIAAGKKASDLLKAFGRNLSRPDQNRLLATIAKAQSKFTRAFTRAESKGGCPFVGDAAAIEATVDAAVSTFVDDIDVPSPEICGDGILAEGEQCDASASGGESACSASGLCLPPAVVAGDPECLCADDPTPVGVGGAHRGVVRPVEGGNSVFNSTGATCLLSTGFISTGTLGAVVYPTGAPSVPYVLSNHHVLGRQSDHDSTTADDPSVCLGTPETTAGEPVMQPGTLDGGTPGIHDVGSLPPFVLGAVSPSLDPYEPICFPSGYCPGAPGFPLPLCNGGACVDASTENCIDAAIGKITAPAAMPPGGLAAILDIGPNAGFGAPIGPPTCKDADVDVGLIGRVVKKSGRTTGLTWGRITGIIDVPILYGVGICSVGSGNAGEDCLVDADCPVSTPGACVFTDTGYGSSLGAAPVFVNQILISSVVSGDFSMPGDSGSVIFTGADEPVGLLFAGGAGTTIANPIRPVLDRFGVGF